MTYDDFTRFLDNVSMLCILIFILVVIVLIVLQVYRRGKRKMLSELKKASKKKAHGIIFGKKGRKRIYSPENAEGMVGIFSATGTGKTSSVLIPTLRSWKSNSYTIDISGDISKNVNCPHKLIFAPESPETIPYNIFGPIDDLKSSEAKNEALEQLAFLLMPDEPNMNANAKFFHVNGRKILTAALIGFYGQMDFIEIAEKVVGTSWQDLFRAIDKTENQNAIMYINGFSGASEQNTSGCKQSCDDALKLFATNHNVKNSIRRPKEGESSLEPKRLETNNIFVIVGEDKLNLYAPLLNILTSQIMQYIGTRQVTPESPTILISLDEYPSLKLDAELILDAVRRFRKRKCRLILLMQNTVDMDILYRNNTTRAILANLKYKVLLGGLGEPSSMQYMAELIGYKDTKKRSISKNSRTSTMTDSWERRYRIEPADLDRQGKDTAILITYEAPEGYIKLKKNYYFKK